MAVIASPAGIRAEHITTRNLGVSLGHIREYLKLNLF